MKKQEFLRALWNKLSELPKEDIETSLDYYAEMIEDRMESQALPIPADRLRQTENRFTAATMMIITEHRYRRRNLTQLSSGFSSSLVFRYGSRCSWWDCPCCW